MMSEQDVLPYFVALCRPETEVIFDDAGRPDPQRLNANIDVYCKMIRRAANVHQAKIVVFPQFALTGYAMVDGSSWVEASVSFSGAELARLRQAAEKENVYVVLQAAERHNAFPDRHFLSAAIFNPEGGVGIVHRKNYAMSMRTSPIDVYDRFVDTFGADAFFPVLDTPLGKLGLAIGAEVHWPEAIRALALKGAEVILNPIASVVGVDYLGRPGAELVRGTRAFENQVYLAMTNIAAENAPEPQAYDFQGRSIGVAADRDIHLAEIDVAALRQAREQPAANFLAQLQPPIHEPWDSLSLWPKNAFFDKPAQDAEQLLSLERESWQRLQDRNR